MDLSKIKPLTATRLMVLQEIEAVILQGDDSLHATLEYLFAVSQPVSALIKASTSKAAWKLAVLTFGDEVELSDFNKIQEHIEKDFERINKASVEPTEGDSTKKE